jgi:hypothetical protein
LTQEFSVNKVLGKETLRELSVDLIVFLLFLTLDFFWTPFWTLFSSSMPSVKMFLELPIGPDSVFNRSLFNSTPGSFTNCAIVSCLREATVGLISHLDSTSQIGSSITAFRRFAAAAEELEAFVGRKKPVILA